MKNFHQLMGGGYFVQRERKPIAHTYWGKAVDPSGVTRDMASRAEAAVQVADCADEIAWVVGDRQVLDLGCGSGAVMRALIDRGAYAVGVDPDPVARKLASDACPDFSEVKASVDDLVCCAAHPEPKWFQSMICYHAIEHMEDPFETMRKALVFCGNGAPVVISTPDFNSPSAQHYGDRYRLLHDQTHISLFSTDSLVRMMESLGLEIIRVAHPFYGTRWEREALDWDPVGKEWSPPAPGNIVSVYAVKR